MLGFRMDALRRRSLWLLLSWQAWAGRRAPAVGVFPWRLMMQKLTA
jgi:hypothetical protein